MHLIRCFLRCLTCFAMIGAAAAASTTPAQGIAVPIGGALKADNAEIWSRLVHLAGGNGARFAVLATAASDPEKSAASIIANLNRHGAVAAHIPVAPRLKGSAAGGATAAAEDPALAAQIRAGKGVYFAGGDQERIVATLVRADGTPTAVLAAIWEVFNAGGVVAGSSAGAAIMSTTMFRDAPDVLGVLKSGVKEGREISRGLGFAGPAVFVDQHFLRRGRLGRLLPAMRHSGYQLGLGVEENSAAIVIGETVEAIGAKGTLVVDLTDADSTEPAIPFNIRNARLSHLDRGDRYNLRTRVVTPSAEKLAGKKLDPNSTDYSPYFSSARFYADVLGDSVVANLLGNLIDNRQKTLTGLAFAPDAAATARPELGFEFRFRKGPDSLGYFSSAGGGEDYTVINVLLDVTPVRFSRPLYRPYRSAPAPRAKSAAQ